MDYQEEGGFAEVGVPGSFFEGACVDVRRTGGSGALRFLERVGRRWRRKLWLRIAEAMAEFETIAGGVLEDDIVVKPSSYHSGPSMLRALVWGRSAARRSTSSGLLAQKAMRFSLGRWLGDWVTPKNSVPPGPRR